MMKRMPYVNFVLVIAGDVANIKVCSTLILSSGLTGNYNAICHYSYNMPSS